MKIRETIVVEGKDDEALLKQFYEVDIIRTEGTHLSQKTLEQIKEAAQHHGIIVFTDPDHPGEEIRRKINEAIPGAKNAFLTSKSRRKNKVGVEHASREEIEEALANLLTFTKEEDSLSRKEFNDLGLSGKANSAYLRVHVEDYYHLGHGSAKTLFARLNSRRVTKEELRKVIENYHDERHCDNCENQGNHGNL